MGMMPGNSFHNFNNPYASPQMWDVTQNIPAQWIYPPGVPSGPMPANTATMTAINPIDAISSQSNPSVSAGSSFTDIPPMLPVALDNSNIDPRFLSGEDLIFDQVDFNQANFDQSNPDQANLDDATFNQANLNQAKSKEVNSSLQH
jgi:hypothetical protein